MRRPAADRWSLVLRRLYITGALPEDSGNYSCEPAGTNPVSVLLHVIEGTDPRQNGEPLTKCSFCHIC